MYTHNLDPIIIDFGFIALRWYSLAYIFGILIGWWYGKRIIIEKFKFIKNKFEISEFDNLITYLIFAIIIGGRVGYIIFYNPSYYISNPLESLKIWQGGMSFHGALIGVIVATYFFSIKKKIETLFLLDIIACVSPIGIFLGRLANFINGELVGKISTLPWSVVFPNIDMMPRHPSHLYEAMLEGVVLFLIMRFFILNKNYKTGDCAYIFLICYGVLRVFSELFREPDAHIGYFFGLLSMGTILSLIMTILGLTMFYYLRKKNEFRS